MNLSHILAFLCLSGMSASVMYLLRISSKNDSSKNDNGVDNDFLRQTRLQQTRQSRGLHQCSSMPDTEFQGSTVLVNTDQSVGPLPTQGDFSIANFLHPDGIDFPNIKAMCNLMASDPLQEAPFCTFETTFERNGGKMMLMGTPPDLTIMGGTGPFVGVWGSMTTGEDFERGDNGIMRFTAQINYCMTCDESPHWQDNVNWATMRGGESKNCEWVSRRPYTRCSEYGTNDPPAGASIRASVACQSSCGCYQWE